MGCRAVNYTLLEPDVKLFRKRETDQQPLVIPGTGAPVFDLLAHQMPLPDWSDYLGDLAEVAA
ncbi:hypothetical protein KAREA_09520 [Prescottella equi]|nr:hypothetical protein KAREA_09520 [Prescottella equi]